MYNAANDIKLKKSIAKTRAGITKPKDSIPQKVLAIDFDGTIHDKAHPVEGMKMGPPMPNVDAALSILIQKGYRIIIHTVMANTESGKQVVADWMRYYRLPYDDIVGKPQADYYIDDRAIEFKDWNSVSERVE